MGLRARHSSGVRQGLGLHLRESLIPPSLLRRGTELTLLCFCPLISPTRGTTGPRPLARTPAEQERSLRRSSSGPTDLLQLRGPFRRQLLLALDESTKEVLPSFFYSTLFPFLPHGRAAISALAKCMLLGRSFSSGCFAFPPFFFTASHIASFPLTTLAFHDTVASFFLDPSRSLSTYYP